jgi:membrane dipeptidase
MPLRKNDFQISLEKAKDIESYTQVFAIWIPDELRKQSAVNYFNKVCDYYENELKQNKSLITPYTAAGEKDGRVKAILAVEGGAALGGKIDGLYSLYERGVKILTLTWNAENELGFGSACKSGGLKQFGKEVLKRMEALNMVVDVSHLNQEGFFDVAENTEKAFIASHSNADIVDNEFGRRRNLTDEQIAVIKDRGGLIGLNFCKDFFDTDGKTGADALKLHIDYLLERDCENVLALGVDFDGCTVTDGVSGIESMGEVYNALIKSGYSEKLINNIFYNNAERFFRSRIL